MLNKVREYIEKNYLLGEELYVVALSGGADSVCLLRLMNEMGYKVEAAHCNFRLRGEESDRDEQFCEDLCKSQKVPFHRVHFDTREYAELHHVSIEMAARELRYSYFERLRIAIGAEAVVVAHHRDDSIETLLLNLLRGTGIYGLQGIKPRNNNIIRPLLCLTKEEILAYLDSIHQDFITDSSNLVDDVKRNNVRLNIIPLLKEINPSALENIQQSMENVREAIKVYDESIARSVAQCFSNNTISLPQLRKSPSAESVLYEILKDFCTSSNLVREIYDNLEAPTGKYWQSGEWIITKDRDTLIIDKTPEPFQELRIPEEGIYCFKGGKISIETLNRTEDFVPSREADFITLDADKVTYPLILRQVREGDTFVPFGMRGKKLISDFLTDQKANYFEKKTQLVLTDAEGKILWVVGRRVSQQVSVTSDTIKIVSVRYLNKTEEF